MAKVSVCIPVYNGEKYIATTINSILDQTFQDFEIIISDNCSNDNTLDVIKAYSDNRIRLIENKEHTPMYPNFNRCLRAARGKYIKFLLADDYFITKAALSRFVRVLDDNEDVGIASTISIPVDQDGLFLQDRYGSRLEKYTNNLVGNFLKNNNRAGYISNDTLPGEDGDGFEISSLFLPDLKISGERLINIIYRSGTDRFCQSPTHTCFRNEFIKDIGMFNEEVSSGWGTETEYWTRILLKRNFYKINSPLVAFRLHSEAATELVFKRKLQFVDLLFNYKLILRNCGSEISYASKLIGRLSFSYDVIKHFIRSLIHGETIALDHIFWGVRKNHLFFVMAFFLFPAISIAKKCGNDLF